MPLMFFNISLFIAGLFTLTLGSVHFFFPKLLDFAHAIPKDGPPLRPFHLGPIRYATQRSDVHGIAWLMNHHTSFVLVSIGLIDIFGGRWLQSPTGRWLALWISAWWFLRAASQLYLGRRRGDWLILAGFSALAVLHLLVGLASLR